MAEMIPLASLLSIPGKTLDEACVEQYIAGLDDAEPVCICRDQAELVVANGYHRVEAARRLGRSQILANVKTVPNARNAATKYRDLGD
jgi:hypothetical protein